MAQMTILFNGRAFGAIRAAAEVSQERLSELSGVSQATISGLETATRPPTVRRATLTALAGALLCDPTALALDPYGCGVIVPVAEPVAAAS